MKFGVRQNNWVMNSKMGVSKNYELLTKKWYGFNFKILRCGCQDDLPDIKHIKKTVRLLGLLSNSVISTTRMQL